MSQTDDVKPGQVRRPALGEPTWHVIRVADGQVDLSGPGPCRGVDTQPLDVVRTWELVRRQ